MPTDHALIIATALAPGDTIVNLGTVMATSTVGVFVVLSIQSERWSLATGAPVVTTWDLVLHCREEVLGLR